MKEFIPYLLIPLATYTGYLVPRKSNVTFAETQSTKYTTRSNHIRDTKSSSHSGRIRSIAENIGKPEQGTKEAGTIEPVAISDIPAVISYLLTQAGPSGLPSESLNAIDEMITRWAKEDYHEALTWARSHPNRTAALDFVQRIIMESNDKDFNTTLDTIRDIIQRDKLELELSDELFNKAANHGVHDAFKIFATFTELDVNGGFSVNVNAFPPDFDFKTFAELSYEHLKKINRSNDNSYDLFPMNLLARWAEKNNTEALEFFLTNDLPSNELGAITTTFLDLNHPESCYPWFKEQYDSLEGEYRSRFVRSLHTIFPELEGAAPLINLVNSFPDQTSKNELVIGMLKGFDEYNISRYVDLISVIPNPAERLRAIQASNLTRAMEDVSDEKLAEYGITRSQIEALNSGG